PVLLVTGHHDEARIGTAFVVLQSGDNQALLTPTTSPVEKSVNAGELAASPFRRFSHQFHGRSSGLDQAVVAGDANHVIDAIAVAPVEHAVATEAAVSPEDNLSLGPMAADKLHQQRQNRPAMTGGVDVAGTQVADQQMTTAEDIKRQKAVVVVIAVEETAFLMPMDGHVRRIKVEHNFRRGRVVLGDEVLPEDTMGFHHGFTVGLLLQAPQR